MTVQELMTLNPATLGVQATIAEAWDLMRDLEIRHVPVVDASGGLVGMVSDRDIARVDVGRLLIAQGARGLEQELRIPIVKIMSSDVITVEAETELSEVVDLLIESKVGALPVIEPETRAVVGIVSYIDVLRALQEVLDEE